MHVTVFHKQPLPLSLLLALIDGPAFLSKEGKGYHFRDHLHAGSETT